MNYADLMAGKLFNSTIAAQSATLTDPSKFKVIGTRVPRIEIPDVVSGKYTYIQNVRVPGMLHGRVVRPRGQGALTQGAKVLSVDESSIKHIAGAQVVRKGDFIGVVRAEGVRRDPGERAAEGEVGRDADAAGQRQPREGAPRPGQPAA